MATVQLSHTLIVLDSAVCSLSYTLIRAMGSFWLANSRCFVRQIFPGLPSTTSRQYSLNISAELLQTRGFIDGRWVSASSTFPVVDPATGQELAQVSDCGPQQAQEAVSAAYKAFYSWKERIAKVNKLTFFFFPYDGISDVSFMYLHGSQCVDKLILMSTVADRGQRSTNAENSMHNTNTGTVVQKRLQILSRATKP